MERSRWSCGSELWLWITFNNSGLGLCPTDRMIHILRCVRLNLILFTCYCCVCGFPKPQRLLMYSNAWSDSCESILLLSSSVSLPKLSCHSHVLDFSNSSVIRTGKMFITIYKFLTILILWETNLIACPGQRTVLQIHKQGRPLTGAGY